MCTRSFLIAGLAAACLSACRSRPSTLIDEAPEAVLQRLRAGSGAAVGASLGNGAVTYLGFEVDPAVAAPGDTVRITHYWHARRPLGRAYRVFVHALAQGAAGWIPHGDHEPAPSTDAWPQNAVIRDEHPLTLPSRLPATEVELRVGLFVGEQRLPVDDAAHQDGTDRLLAGRFRVTGEPVPLPRYVAPQLARAPTLDGRVDEEEWGGAPWIDGFTRSRGDRPSELATKVRLAWAGEALFVAWIAADPDLQATLSGRDAPVYREEALELFVRPTAASDYVELQASPTGTLFDAAFSGGPRRNMDKSFDAGFEVATHLEGSVNEPQDRDRTWTSEWRVDLRSLRGAAVPVAPGTVWRINLFRVGKDMDEQGELRADESAWSPPLMGDFHNLERFGELVFGPALSDRTPQP